jgi:transposase-like protein
MVNDNLIMPISGQDYPSTWEQFLDWFPDEKACREYLVRLRWPRGFVCPRCGEASEVHQVSRARFMCPHCCYQCTATAGTIFDKTRTSLRSWFAAVWYITNQKQGVTALGLQRVLGIGSYQTAWMMLHRLRRAMIRPARERLSGVVEVDESFVGRSAPNKGRIGKQAKRLADQYNMRRSIVAIAVEIKDPKGFGRVRLRRIHDTSEASLLPFVQDSIEPGSHVRTDGSWAYRSLQENGYRRDKKVMVGADDPAHVSMPGVHRVAALLKRWLLGTHQGSVKPHQMDAYLDEFAFRFNRRSSRSRGLLFYRLLEQAVVTEPVTYGQIVGGTKHRK